MLKLRPTIEIPGVVYPNESELLGYINAGLIGDKSLIEAMIETHDQFPKNPALVGPEGVITHSELDDITNRIACSFWDLGLKPLDRVVFQIPNCNELLMGYLACLKAGLIPICTLVSHREKEIHYLANISNARMQFVQGDDPNFDHVSFAEEAQKKVNSLEIIVMARGQKRGSAITLNALYQGKDPVLARTRVRSIKHDPLQVILFQLSGGTTDVPKIIPRFGGEYFLNMRSVANWYGYLPSDVMYNPAPFIHNFNMVCCSGPMLLSGGAMALAPKLDAQTVQDVIKTFKPNWLVLGGPILAKLAPFIQNNEINFSHVKGIFSTSGSKRISDMTGAPAFHVFGMTEGVIMHTRPQDPLEAREKSVGMPVCSYDQVKILKPDSEEKLSEGEIGEAVFKGPYTTHGYYKSEDRNRVAFTSDGFYRSGDLMSCKSIQGQLYYFFEGRIKDVIDRGGEKINATEVEQAILNHQNVGGCAVIGIKDKDYGEKMCACIVRKNKDLTFTVQELGEFLKHYGLAKFKWPERIEFINELPITHAGKLDKNKLRNTFQAN